MIPSFIITFRETLEAALIIGIILSYLLKTKQTKYNKIVYVGIGFGIMASVIGALVFTRISGSFTGKAEEIFEGITMIIGALLLSTMILWMMKQKHIAGEIEKKVAVEISEAHKFGLFSLVFISVFREGIETVIFLGAANFVSADNSLIGALLGITAAVFLGYLVFVASMKINIRRFFNISSFILVFFAAGLIAHGVHEFQKAEVVPVVIEHVWDLNPELNPGGTYPQLHEKGYVGSILKGLFGYNGNPSLIEVVSWLAFLGLFFILWKNIEKVYKVL